MKLASRLIFTIEEAEAKDKADYIRVKMAEIRKKMKNMSMEQKKNWQAKLDTLSNALKNYA